jgi:uncharacterized alpha-E superfamily protein
MISRVAESCFWLHRYLERAENMARLLDANRSIIPDLDLASYRRWHPMIIVAGEEERFIERVGEDALEDGDEVQEYLVWDEECPVSVYSSIKWARENARTIRETISSEVFDAMNGFWLWISGPASAQYRKDRDGFYQHVRKASLLFHGVCHNTMLHVEPFQFMALGMLLERAAQTARILDIHHHALIPTEDGAGTPAEAPQWLAILSSCSATDAFFKHTRKPLTSRAVAQFLILEESFPRSIRHCLVRADRLMTQLRPGDRPKFGERSSAGGSSNSRATPTGCASNSSRIATATRSSGLVHRR